MRIVEDTLRPRALAPVAKDGISAATQGIVLAGGRARMPALAASAGLGVRQFERRFLHQVGMPPRLFVRIARFEAALEYKARYATSSWNDVAHQFGYYDQMHMVHDFAEFTGATPSETLNQLETVYVEQVESMRAGRALPELRSFRLVF